MAFLAAKGVSGAPVLDILVKSVRSARLYDRSIRTVVENRIDTNLTSDS